MVILITLIFNHRLLGALWIWNQRPRAKGIHCGKPSTRIPLWVSRHSVHQCWPRPQWNIHKGHDSGWELWVSPNQILPSRSSAYICSRSVRFNNFFSPSRPLSSIHKCLPRILFQIPGKSSSNLTNYDVEPFFIFITDPGCLSLGVSLRVTWKWKHISELTSEGLAASLSSMGSHGLPSYSAFLLPVFLGWLVAFCSARVWGG